jgi:hypothetical protein
VVLPLLRRYFLVSRGFEYFVGAVLSRASAALENREADPRASQEFFTEGSEENKDSYLHLIPNPLSYLRFLLFSFSRQTRKRCEDAPKSAARENREADPAKQAGGVIRLRPAVAGVRRDRLITNHSGITDWSLV